MVVNVMEDIETKKPLLVELDFPVRTYDVDYAGVVSNLVYLRWTEDLRLTVLEVYYPLERLLEAGLAPTLTETLIRYYRPARINDKVWGRMWVDRLTKIKVLFKAEIYANGELAAAAEQKGCLIHLPTGRVALIPDELVQIYQDSAHAA
jgi:acyl-CoA thioester hydrolase